jgi:hypothetical protein
MSPDHPPYIFFLHSSRYHNYPLFASEESWKAKDCALWPKFRYCLSHLVIRIFFARRHTLERRWRHSWQICIQWQFGVRRRDQGGDSLGFLSIDATISIIRPFLLWKLLPSVSPPLSEIDPPVFCVFFIIIVIPVSSVWRWNCFFVLKRRWNVVLKTFFFRLTSHETISIRIGDELVFFLIDTTVEVYEIIVEKST